MESKKKKTPEKSRSYSEMVILYEYYMKSRISSHWPKVHYGMPAEKKRKSFDLMMVIHMHICLTEKNFFCMIQDKTRKINLNSFDK